MAIPEIIGYSMPTDAELPAPTPPWRPDRHRAVLLIHDMQRYFVDRFPVVEPPMTDLLTNLCRIRAWAGALGIPVLYTAQPARMTRAERGLLFDFWGAGMTAEPGADDIVDAVRPAPGDTVIRRHRYSAFHGSELGGALDTLGRDQLIVTGVYAHIGCLMTAVDAFSRGIQPFLVADAVADFTAAHHRMALHYAAHTCAVTLTTRQLLALLGPHRRNPTGTVSTALGQPLAGDAGQLHA